MKVVFHCDNPNVDDVLTAVAQHVDIDVVKSGYRRRTDGEDGKNQSKTYEIDQPFCSAEHLTELIGDVVRNEASLGILFDRNAQKSILVDETGKVLSDHQIGSIAVSYTHLKGMTIMVIPLIITTACRKTQSKEKGLGFCRIIVDKKEKGIWGWPFLPEPFCQFLEVHCSELKPYPLAYSAKASI